MTSAGHAPGRAGRMLALVALLSACAGGADTDANPPAFLWAA